MGSLADCPERTRVNEELDRAECALQQLRQINQDIEDAPWVLHLADEHRVTPRHVPRYAKRNWSAIKAVHGKSSKPIEHARVEDLCDLTEGLARAPKKARDAWQQFHQTWATILAAVAIDEASLKPRAEPYSRRSVFEAMGDERRRAITAYKRLKCRATRNTGKRSRLPSAEARATLAWEKANPALASVLSAVALTNEHIPYLAQQMGVTVTAYLKTLRMAVDALQAAKAERLNGSQQVPRKKVKINGASVDQVLSVSAFETTTNNERTLN